MAGLTLVTPPTVEPISIDDLKDHLNIPQSDTSFDGQLDVMITAARMIMEGPKWPGIGVSLNTQTWKYLADGFSAPTDSVFLPRPPVQSVTSVTVTDASGNVTNLVQNTDYILDISNSEELSISRARLVPKTTWPTTGLAAANGLAFTYVAGYGANATDVPANLRIGLLMLAATVFENREAAGDQNTVGSLLKKTYEAPFGYGAIVGQFVQDGC